MHYRPEEIEAKWRKHWNESGLYRIQEDSSKPKYYVLDMFPYPSGAGLHVGHPLGYIASDIFSRYQRMKGFNVLHPMGFDAFGLPAEEYAIQTGIHPAKSTEQNMETYRRQLRDLGFSFDWDREVQTCAPEYYKWTQWIFTQLFDHVYDQEADKAVHVSNLVAHLEQHGTDSLPYACEEELTFTASEWQGYSPKEKSDVLMNYRLAYRKIGYVNWCEELGTVLANDQVKDGLSERGGHPVIQKPMTQWYLRITAYAQRLLDGLEDLEWSDALKTMQRNWIGRSEGAQVFFDIDGSEEKIEIFTTRPDTIFGATYMVLAPEHELVQRLTTDEQRASVEEYVSKVMSKSEIERMAEREVSGVWLGAYAINPMTDERIPIWIGEYVLKDYGTGAIMAVPSDDDRDHNFAEKFDLPIIQVIDKSAHPNATRSDKVGKLINSGFLNGLEVKEAISKACEVIEERQRGKAQINYRMRDANFSRQRYWGEPFPIVYDTNGIPSALSVEHLPVELPATDNFKPAKDESPLARMQEWVNELPGYTRETDVMPAVAGSSWYYLRYMDPANNDALASDAAIKYWKDVDLYVGGAEHAVAHLLYARFWHKFLYDMGKLPTQEPFKKLINQGMIQGVIEFIHLDKRQEEGMRRFVSAELAEREGAEHFVKIPVHVSFVSDYGSDQSYLSEQGIKEFSAWRKEYTHATFEGVDSSAEMKDGSLVAITPDFKMTTSSEVGKMSKRLFNVINPDDVISQYGTDCFRMYEMFLGPIEQSKPWDTNGIDGVYKFLKKFWRLFVDDHGLIASSEEASAEELKILHTCIKKINGDVEKFSFNTCISALMICTNSLRDLTKLSQSTKEDLTKLIAPFAPHLADELWSILGHQSSVHLESFPSHEESYLTEDSIEYPLCINGKKRAMASFPADMQKSDLEKAALTHDGLSKWLEGSTVRKVIVVPGRMINIVVG